MHIYICTWELLGRDDRPLRLGLGPDLITIAYYYHCYYYYFYYY